MATTVIANVKSIVAYITFRHCGMGVACPFFLLSVNIHIKASQLCKGNYLYFSPPCIEMPYVGPRYVISSTFVSQWKIRLNVVILQRTADIVAYYMPHYGIVSVLSSK